MKKDAFIDAISKFSSEKNPSIEKELNTMLILAVPGYDPTKHSSTISKLLGSSWSNPSAPLQKLMSDEEIDKAYSSFKDKALYEYSRAFRESLLTQLTTYHTIIFNPKEADGLLSNIIVAVGTCNAILAINKWSKLAKLASAAPIVVGSSLAATEILIAYALTSVVSSVTKKASEILSKDDIENAKNVLTIFQSRSEEQLVRMVDSLALKVTESKKDQILGNIILSKKVESLVESKIKEIKLDGSAYETPAARLALYDITALTSYVAKNYLVIGKKGETLIDSISDLIVTGKVNSTIDSSSTIVRAVFEIEFDNPLLNDQDILKELVKKLNITMDTLIDRSCKLLENGLRDDLRNLVEENDIDALEILLSGDFYYQEI